jgi:hypothetical protein
VLVAAILLLLAFGRYARSVVAPAVDLTLFRFRSFWVGTLAGGLCRVGLNGVPFLLPLMLQVGFGMSPVTSGSLTFVGSFGALLMRPLLSSLLRRYGFGVVLIGSALVGSGTVAGFALMSADTPHWVIGLCLPVRDRPSAVHELQHFVLFRPAGGQAQPCHQPRRRAAAAQRFAGVSTAAMLLAWFQETHIPTLSAFTRCSC